MNALKHGVFASELNVSKLETPEYGLLYQALYNQLAPVSTMQQIERKPDPARISLLFAIYQVVGRKPPAVPLDRAG
jgi:hypothetical protein